VIEISLGILLADLSRTSARVFSNCFSCQAKHAYVRSENKEKQLNEIYEIFRRNNLTRYLKSRDWGLDKLEFPHMQQIQFFGAGISGMNNEPRYCCLPHEII